MSSQPVKTRKTISIGSSLSRQPINSVHSLHVVPTQQTNEATLDANKEDEQFDNDDDFIYDDHDNYEDYDD